VRAGWRRPRRPG